MMSYLFLIGSALCFTSAVLIRKQYQRICGATLYPSLLFLCVYSSISAVLTFILSGPFVPDLLLCSLALIFAVFAMAAVVICIIGTAHGSLPVLVLYAVLGTLVIPSVYGIAIEKEPLNLGKIIGMALSLTIVLMDYIKNRQAKKGGKLFTLLCGLLFLTNGSLLVIYKMVTTYRPTVKNYSFISLYMATSAVMALLFMLFLKIRNKTVSAHINKSAGLIIVAYALLITANETFVSLCTKNLPIIIQASVSFCLPIIFTAFFDFLFFKQRPTKVVVAQILIAFLACFCFVLS